MYYKLDTKQKAEKLPAYITIQDGVNTRVKYTQDIKEHAPDGWREMPAEPVAAAGTQIISVTWVQDDKDPLKVKPVVESKTDAQIALDKQNAEKASSYAEIARITARQKWIDEIAAPFKDAQAVAIRALAEQVRTW